jgi:hypothetical protein
MIKSVNSSGRYLTVSGGSPSSTYISPGAVGSGMMRYNGNMNCIEVNDGNSWIQLQSNYATVELTPDSESLLEWARKERDKQWARDERIRKNPALKKAYEAIQRAEANFDILDKIIGDESDTGQMIYPGGGLVTPVVP